METCDDVAVTVAQHDRERSGIRDPNVQDGKRSPARIRRRSPDHVEPKCPVEPERVLILLVDVDRQGARGETLRVRHEERPTAPAAVVGVDEQGLDRVTREANVCIDQRSR
jgi:hypothetical protein